MALRGSGEKRLGPRGETSRQSDKADERPKHLEAQAQRQRASSTSISHDRVTGSPRLSRLLRCYGASIITAACLHRGERSQSPSKVSKKNVAGSILPILGGGGLALN